MTKRVHNTPVKVEYEEDPDEAIQNLQNYVMDIDQLNISDSEFESDGEELEITVGTKYIDDLEMEKNPNVTIQVQYPPKDMALYKHKGDGSCWHVNREKKGMVALFNVPKDINEVNLDEIFYPYHLDKIVVIRDDQGPIGTAFLFGVFYFLKMIEAWAPNVIINDHQLRAIFINDDEVPRLLPANVYNALKGSSHRLLRQHLKQKQ
ncbi:unnamed protein product [Bursaphelenchus okinawaensis]|uniref:Uncharacterized protein n=1 Tax=Bursaphelenchus okinawaensis TaxID=465554 RepID=A0A811LS11_9BILA|nr:unnamed protein product [Bursaphelenchus okinawaensis]CAG9127568.1 unnamed protein product [Bursaphelenchus okinawaensis]